MKKNRLSLAICLLLLGLTKAFCQNTQLFAIAPFPLEITYHKTVNLVFPYAIKSVDKGSRDLLAQKAKGIENILQVKAAKIGFIQTNLTVVTSDGKLYCFVVDYADQPLQLSIELLSGPASSPAALFGQTNQALIAQTAMLAATDPGTMRRIRETNHGARLSLTGICISENVLFYRLQLDNQANISYDIENLRFFIRDKKQAKRTAVQQKEILPLYKHADTTAVAANSSHVFVFALPKFTIPDQKQLRIELFEKNGGRHIELCVSNRAIVKARPLP